jgi:hypothetical protein
LAVGDADDRAVAFGVGLGAADVEHEPGGLGLDGAERERDELGAAEGRGVPDEDHRGVADADRGGAVDAVDDLADLLDRQRSGQPSGHRAVGASQPAPHLADGESIKRALLT